MINRKALRKKRNFRLRKKIFGTNERPRLVVFASNKHFYVQIINDQKHETLVAFSTLHLPNKNSNNQNICSEIGKNIALLAKNKNIKTVVFDRAGFLFHGKIKSFADAVRANGIIF